MRPAPPPPAGHPHGDLRSTRSQQPGKSPERGPRAVPTLPRPHPAPVGSAAAHLIPRARTRSLVRSKSGCPILPPSAGGALHGSVRDLLTSRDTRSPLQVCASGPPASARARPTSVAPCTVTGSPPDHVAGPRPRRASRAVAARPGQVPPCSAAKGRTTVK